MYPLLFIMFVASVVLNAAFAGAAVNGHEWAAFVVFTISVIVAVSGCYLSVDVDSQRSRADNMEIMRDGYMSQASLAESNARALREQADALREQADAYRKRLVEVEQSVADLYDEVFPDDDEDGDDDEDEDE